MHVRIKVKIMIIIMSIVSLALLSSTCNLIHVSRVNAQEIVAYYSKYNVDIRVNLDGSISVNETITIIFVKGSFTYAYREIPYYGFDDIINVKIYEVVQESLIEYTIGSNEAGHFSVKKEIWGVKIKWWYEKISVNNNPVNKTFLLSYTVTSAIDVDILRGINYLHWYALPNEHLFIEESTIRISLPLNIDSSSLTIKPAPSRIIEHNKIIEIEYYMKNLNEHESLEIYIAFPKIINPPFSIRKTLNKYTALISILIIITPIPLLALYRYRIKKRIGINNKLYSSSTEPPRDLDETQIHVLKSPYTSRILPLVTLFQLARKKLIKFIQSTNEIYIRAESTNRINELKPWESELLEVISRKDKIKLKDLYKELNEEAFLSRTKDRILEILVKKNYFPDYPSKMGLKQAIITLLTLMLTSILLIIIGNLSLIASLLINGSILFIIAIICAIAVKILSIHRTRQGELTLLKAKAYVKYLESRLKNIINLQDKNKIIEALNLAISNNFSWIIAINEIKAFKRLKELSKILTKQKKTNKEWLIIYWHPFWLHYTSTKGETLTLGNLAETLSNLSSIFIKSGSGFISGGSGVSGISGTAGGGGTAGVG